MSFDGESSGCLAKGKFKYRHIDSDSIEKNSHFFVVSGTNGVVVGGRVFVVGDGVVVVKTVEVFLLLGIGRLYFGDFVTLGILVVVVISGSDISTDFNVVSSLSF